MKAILHAGRKARSFSHKRRNSLRWEASPSRAAATRATAQACAVYRFARELIFAIGVHAERILEVGTC